jgi:hypothetical protein
LSQGFFFHFFMILALRFFCHFPLNKETPKNNIPSTYKPNWNWKRFKFELTLKMVKSHLPSPSLITNDYLPLYIQHIPQNCPLYTCHNFTNVKMLGFKSFTYPKLCCLHFLFRMAN